MNRSQQLPAPYKRLSDEIKQNPVFLSIFDRENEKRALKRELVFDSQRKRQLKLRKTLLPSSYNG